MRVNSHPVEIITKAIQPLSFYASSWASTDVQYLTVGYPDVPSFMPRIRRYFGCFLDLIRAYRWCMRLTPPLRHVQGLLG